MIESKENFSFPNINDKFYTKDGKTITLEELQNGFLEMMANSKKILEFPKEKIEQKIKFLIQVFLVDKKIFSKKELNSEKAETLVNNLHEFFINQHHSEKTKAKLVFTKDQTESMIQQARKQQLGEKSRAKLTDEEETDIYGQSISEFDRSRER